jgi:hypothetical protein
LPGLDNRPLRPDAKLFQSAAVGGGGTVTTVVVVEGTVVVVTGGTVVVVGLVVVELVVVVALVVLVVVVAGSLVLDDEVVPPALCRLPPHAAANAARLPRAPARSSRRRLSSRPQGCTPLRYSSRAPPSHPAWLDLPPTRPRFGVPAPGESTTRKARKARFSCPFWCASHFWLRFGPNITSERTQFPRTAPRSSPREGPPVETALSSISREPGVSPDPYPPSLTRRWKPTRPRSTSRPPRE